MSILRAALIGVGLALFVRTFLVEPLAVRSGSMEPTLLVGDHILVNRFVFAPEPAALLPQRRPRRGEVVALRDPHDPHRRLLKRCVALGGDRVDRESGESIVLTPAQLYLLGDHGEDSRDSRSWGPVDASLVRGRPLLIYWSRSLEGAEPSSAPARAPDPSSRIKASLLERLAATRWERVGRPID